MPPKRARRGGDAGVWLSSDKGTKSGFHVDDKAVEKLLVTEAARAHLEVVLGAAMWGVREAAKEHEDTGKFKESIFTEVRTVIDKGGIAKGRSHTTAAAQRRLVGFVASYDPKWHLLEYGAPTIKPARRTFARGFERAGLFYRPTGKGG